VQLWLWTVNPETDNSDIVSEKTGGTQNKYFFLWMFENMKANFWSSGRWTKWGITNISRRGCCDMFITVGVYSGVVVRAVYRTSGWRRNALMELRYQSVVYNITLQHVKTGVGSFIQLSDTLDTWWTNYWKLF
jgi:hypothetical protein